MVLRFGKDTEENVRSLFMESEERKERKEGTGKIVLNEAGSRQERIKLS